jgi:hypothetical protein
MTPALAFQRLPQPSNAGQDRGQQLVVAVEQVGHAALGDGEPAPAQDGMDLRYAAVLAVAQQPDQAMTSRPSSCCGSASAPSASGRYGRWNRGNPASRSSGSAGAAAPRRTASPNGGDSRSAAACGKRRQPGAGSRSTLPFRPLAGRLGWRSGPQRNAPPRPARLVRPLRRGRHPPDLNPAEPVAPLSARSVSKWGNSGGCVGRLWSDWQRQQPKSLGCEGISGAPGEVRTPSPQIRSLVLYPVELRAPDAVTASHARLPELGTTPSVNHATSHRCRGLVTPSRSDQAAMRSRGRARRGRIIPGMTASCDPSTNHPRGAAPALREAWLTSTAPQGNPDHAPPRLRTPLRLAGHLRTEPVRRPPSTPASAMIATGWRTLPC